MEDVDQRFTHLLGGAVLGNLYDSRRDPTQKFDDLKITHAAIFMVEYALYKIFDEAVGAPFMVVGASLGEVVAAAVAGALTLDEAIELVALQASLFAETPPQSGMLAVLADETLYADCPDLSQTCEIAVVAVGSHFVVSGALEDLNAAEVALERRGVAYARLPVPYAFHSAHMDRHAKTFATLVGAWARQTTLPLASCTSGRLLSSYSVDNAWRAVRGQVDLGRGLDLAEGGGASLYVDLSPGSPFAALQRRRLPPAERFRVHGVLTPFADEISNLDKAVSAASGLLSLTDEVDR